MFVCPRSYLRNYTTRPIFTKFFVHVTYGRGSVLLCRRSDMLCTSGFMDDVIFAHKPMLLDVAAQLKRSARNRGLGYKMFSVIPVAGQRLALRTWNISLLHVGFALNYFIIC